MPNEEDEGLGEIGSMDPGEPLAAVPDRASDEFFENGNHLAERTSLFAQHDPEPGDYDSDSLHLGLCGFFFPGDSQPCEEIITWGRRFGNLLVPVEPIISLRQMR